MMQYSDRIIDAVAEAWRLHADQKRKGSGAPYITHLFSTAALVAEFGGDEDTFIAALLHDAVEDRGGLETLETIRHRFGERVANMVWACSDSHETPRPPWRNRKLDHIAGVAAAEPAVKMIVAADKLHNIRSIITDLRSHGPQVWERFHGKQEGSLWYFDTMFEALNSNWEHPMLEELRVTLARLHKAADAPEPGK